MSDRESPPQAKISVEDVRSLDALRSEWVELGPKSGNVFSSWEWVSTWWRHYGEDRPLLLAVCRSKEDRLVAILPLYLAAARPLRVARFLGHGPADQLGPVCRPEDRRYAATALARVSENANVHLLFAELLPGGKEWASTLGGRLLHSEASPTLSLGRNWEMYLAGRSANFRQQVRRRERRLARDHVLTFRLADDASRLDDELTLLFRLHAARWGEGTSAFLRWQLFHREFARIALERGWLRLWFLELDGRTVAAWYGFRFGEAESYYQAGRDPDRGDESVGFVLLAHSIREAANDGMREYRFLRGGEPYKLRFADADPGLDTVTLARGPRGRIAGAVVGSALRSDRARSLLGRLAGAVGG